MAKKSTQLDKTICKFNSIYAERRLKKQIDLIEKDRKQVLLKIEREQIVLKKELKDQRRQKMSRVFPEPPDGVEDDETPGRKKASKHKNKPKRKVTIGDDVHEIDEELNGVLNGNGLLTAPGINRGSRRHLANDSDDESSHDSDDSDGEVRKTQSRIRFVDIPTATTDSANGSEMDSPYTSGGYGNWADKVAHMNRSNSVQLPAAPRHTQFSGRPTTSSGAVSTGTTRSTSNLTSRSLQTPLGRSTPMGTRGAAAGNRRPVTAGNGPLYGNSKPPRYSIIKKQIEEEEHETVMRMRKIYQQRENEEVDNKVLCFLGKGVRKVSMPPITTAEEAEILEKIGSLVQQVDRRRKLSIMPPSEGGEDCNRKSSTTSNKS
ncbi:uncharacterized protein LOC118423372 [Branchiostoma floridae]|uniref:Uncharacterized protein LOC118423372 n=1 Tax=Branchiostoma floridae TaxID=7739 RepID=C3ZNV2_BRAFL|nr:uncharacterized protein LOC118423372 [Branchiostoma floridae]|eukprot:XP_002589823.1 hypothetical protein BRAFLDRAFT_90533 [Branchiostoma floridae]